VAEGRGWGLDRHRRRRLASVSRAPRRGDVYWVNLDPVVGTEIRKTRPAVIVSNDSCNRYGTRVVVLPITSNVDSLYPGEAIVEVKGKPGRTLGDQIRSIDKSRLRARAGRLTAEEMSRVDEALAITLDLPP
jgi:mRNA interferase MazF